MLDSYLVYDDYVLKKEAHAADASGTMVSEKLTDEDCTIINSPEQAGTILDLIARMFVTGAYSINKLFASTSEGNNSFDVFSKLLSMVVLDVRVDKANKTVLSVEPSYRLVIAGGGPEEIRHYDEFSVTEDDKTIIYQIQNLNIYITAEVVHQLNVNPQEVINQYHELIKAEVEKMVKNKTK